MQIKKLESDIGLPLTEQIGKKISLTEAGTAFYLVSRDILDRMIHNMDDLYLIGKPRSPANSSFSHISPTRWLWLHLLTISLLTGKAIPLSDIADEHFIMRERGSGTRIAVEQRFADAGLELKIGMELGNNESIKQGITGGLGIAVLSLHTLTSGDMNELTVLDVQGFPISWQWYVGHPRGKRLSIIARTFIDFMYEEGPSLLPENVLD